MNDGVNPPWFKMTYVSPQNTPIQTLEVPSNNRPQSHTGQSGSLLDMALASQISIDHACGGVGACATCHVIVHEGLASCSECSEAESDQLEKASGLTSRSRLACQCVPNGMQDLVIEIPD